MLSYKRYTGNVESDDEAGPFHGEALSLHDVVTFQGGSVEELELTFKDSIDDYLAFRTERGEEPDKPFSGSLTLRLPPELHRKVYTVFKHEGLTQARPL